MSDAQSSWISSSFRKDWVSVITPVFNRANLLREAIHSVHKQTYRPIECVIVDDGSTDDTAQAAVELVSELEDADFSIFVCNQTNKGAPAARNMGTKHAKGEFIQYLDSDDLLYPEKLENQVGYLVHKPECDGVFGDWHHGTLENHQHIKGEKSDDLVAQFYGRRVIHTLSFLFRRRMVDKIGPWDIALNRNQEMDFHLRGVLAGGRFDYLAAVTGLWREHDGARIVVDRGARNVLRFYEKWIDEFETRGIFTTALKGISADYLFWYALKLEPDQKHQILNYLHKALELNPAFPEFSTPKMRLLRQFLGRQLSIRLWYWQCQRHRNSTT